MAELYCFRLFCLSVCLSVRGHYNSLIFNQIYSKFHTWIASINLWFKFEYRFCLASDNQDGQQNPHINISCRGHSNSVIFNQISSKFHLMIASINLSFKFEYRFCPTSDSQDGRQNGRHISISAVLVTLTQSFLIRFLPNLIYGLLPSTSRSSSNTGFVRHLITKMADKMAATYQYPLSWSL